MNWIDSFKSRNTGPDVARAIGMKARMGNSWSPCPACKEANRGSEDKRGALGFTGDHRGWRCHRCDAHGDALDLLAHQLLNRGCTGLARDDWDALREGAVGLGLLNEADATVSADRKPGAAVKPMGDLVAEMVGGASGRRRAAVGTSTPQAPRAESQAARSEEVTSSTGQRRFGWSEGASTRFYDALWSDLPEAKLARDYLMIARKLPEASIREFKLGLYVDADGRAVVDIKGHAGRPWITIPLVDHHEQVVNIRYRTVPVVGTCEHCTDPLGCRKCKSYRVTNDRPLPLFGVERLPNDLGTWVLITEGELDVIAMHAYGYTVGVVSGTAGADTWKDEWLDALEPYAGFVGLYDSDKAGDDGWEKLVEKLGRARCARAALPEKDANGCLVEGVSKKVLDRAIDQAQASIGLEMLKADAFSDDLEMLISNPAKVRGISTGSLELDAKWGGIRPGLIIISGESGQGKTTFATWLLDSLSRRDVPVLITSFEQRPIGTVQKLLRLELGRGNAERCADVNGDFTRLEPEERRGMLSKIGRRPLYVLNHYGHLTAKKTLEAVGYAARRHGVKVALVDHLGFLVDPDTQDERRATDAVVRAATLTAHQLGIAIMMIAHPGNIPKDMPGGKPRRVTARDLKGASAIRQDADDVLIVEALPPEKSDKKGARLYPASMIHFDKVRSEFGAMGASVLLAYDPASTLYADTWDETPTGRAGKLIPHYAPPPRS